MDVEQKAEILTESYESGDKVSAVARRHGLTPQQLFGWRRNVQRRAVRRRGAFTAAGERDFAQVMVEAPAPSAAASCASSNVGRSRSRSGRRWCASVPESMLRR